MENVTKKIDMEEIEKNIVKLIGNLEDCSLDDFLILFYSIVGEFDRVFSKYDVEEFKKAIHNPKIKSFRDLLK